MGKPKPKSNKLLRSKLRKLRQRQKKKSGVVEDYQFEYDQDILRAEVMLGCVHDFDSSFCDVEWKSWSAQYDWQYRWNYFRSKFSSNGKGVTSPPNVPIHPSGEVDGCDQTLGGPSEETNSEENRCENVKSSVDCDNLANQSLSFQSPNQCQINENSDQFQKVTSAHANRHRVKADHIQSVKISENQCLLQVEDCEDMGNDQLQPCRITEQCQSTVSSDQPETLKYNPAEITENLPQVEKSNLEISQLENSTISPTVSKSDGEPSVEISTNQLESVESTVQHQRVESNDQTQPVELSKSCEHVKVVDHSGRIRSLESTSEESVKLSNQNLPVESTGHYQPVNSLEKPRPTETTNQSKPANSTVQLASTNSTTRPASINSTSQYQPVKSIILSEPAKTPSFTPAIKSNESIPAESKSQQLAKSTNQFQSLKNESIPAKPTVPLPSEEKQSTSGKTTGQSIPAKSTNPSTPAESTSQNIPSKLTSQNIPVKSTGGTITAKSTTQPIPAKSTTQSAPTKPNQQLVKLVTQSIPVESTSKSHQIKQLNFSKFGTSPNQSQSPNSTSRSHLVYSSEQAQRIKLKTKHQLVTLARQVQPSVKSVGKIQPVKSTDEYTSAESIVPRHSVKPDEKAKSSRWSSPSPSATPFNKSRTVYPTSPSPSATPFNKSRTVHPTSQSPSATSFDKSRTVHPTSQSPSATSFNKSRPAHPTSQSPSATSFDKSRPVHPTSQSPSATSFDKSRTVHPTSQSPSATSLNNSRTAPPTSQTQVVKTQIQHQQMKSTNRWRPVESLDQLEDVQSSPLDPLGSSEKSQPFKSKIKLILKPKSQLRPLKSADQPQPVESATKTQSINSSRQAQASKTTDHRSRHDESLDRVQQVKPLSKHNIAESSEQYTASTSKSQSENIPNRTGSVEAICKDGIQTSKSMQLTGTSNKSTDRSVRLAGNTRSVNSYQRDTNNPENKTISNDHQIKSMKRHLPSSSQSEPKRSTNQRRSIQPHEHLPADTRQSHSTKSSVRKPSVASTSGTGSVSSSEKFRSLLSKNQPQRTTPTVSVDNETETSDRPSVYLTEEIEEGELVEDPKQLKCSALIETISLPSNATAGGRFSSSAKICVGRTKGCLGGKSGDVKCGSNRLAVDSGLEEGELTASNDYDDDEAFKMKRITKRTNGSYWYKYIVVDHSDDDVKRSRVKVFEPSQLQLVSNELMIAEKSSQGNSPRTDKKFNSSFFNLYNCYCKDFGSYENPLVLFEKSLLSSAIVSVLNRRSEEHRDPQTEFDSKMTELRVAVKIAFQRGIVNILLRERCRMVQFLESLLRKSESEIHTNAEGDAKTIGDNKPSKERSSSEKILEETEEVIRERMMDMGRRKLEKIHFCLKDNNGVQVGPSWKFLWSQRYVMLEILALGGLFGPNPRKSPPSTNDSSADKDETMDSPPSAASSSGKCARKGRLCFDSQEQKILNHLTREQFPQLFYHFRSIHQICSKKPVKKKRKLSKITHAEGDLSSEVQVKPSEKATKICNYKNLRDEFCKKFRGDDNCLIRFEKSILKSAIECVLNEKQKRKLKDILDASAVFTAKMSQLKTVVRIEFQRAIVCILLRERVRFVKFFEGCISQLTAAVDSVGTNEDLGKIRPCTNQSKCSRLHSLCRRIVNRKILNMGKSQLEKLRACLQSYPDSGVGPSWKFIWALRFCLLEILAMDGLFHRDSVKCQCSTENTVSTGESKISNSDSTESTVSDSSQESTAIAPFILSSQQREVLIALVQRDFPRLFYQFECGCLTRRKLESVSSGKSEDSSLESSPHREAVSTETAGTVVESNQKRVILISDDDDSNGVGTGADSAVIDISKEDESSANENRSGNKLHLEDISDKDEFSPLAIKASNDSPLEKISDEGELNSSDGEVCDDPIFEQISEESSPGTTEIRDQSTSQAISVVGSSVVGRCGSPSNLHQTPHSNYAGYDAYSMTSCVSTSYAYNQVPHMSSSYPPANYPASTMPSQMVHFYSANWSNWNCQMMPGMPPGAGYYQSYSPVAPGVQHPVFYPSSMHDQSAGAVDQSMYTPVYNPSQPTYTNYPYQDHSW